jgi:hypothetical protein
MALRGPTIGPDSCSKLPQVTARNPVLCVTDRRLTCENGGEQRALCAWAGARFARGRGPFPQVSAGIVGAKRAWKRGRPAFPLIVRCALCSDRRLSSLGGPPLGLAGACCPGRGASPLGLDGGSDGAQPVRVRGRRWSRGQPGCDPCWGLRCGPCCGRLLSSAAPSRTPRSKAPAQAHRS